MTLDLTDEEARALAKHLRQTIDYSRFPLAPRLDPLKTPSLNRRSLGRNRCRR
jgi:hypothetical protein